MWKNIYRSSHRRCSIKKCILENFAKFTGKRFCRSLFLRTTILQNISERLLPYLTKQLRKTGKTKVQTSCCCCSCCLLVLTFWKIAKNYLSFCFFTASLCSCFSNFSDWDAWNRFLITFLITFLIRLSELLILYFR